MNNIGRRGPRRATRTAATLATLALAARTVCSQPPRMRLGEVYAELERNSPRISATRLLVRALQARVPAAKRLPDPQLQLGSMNRSLPGLAPMPAIGMTQLQVMQMIPLGGKLALAGTVATAYADAANARADNVVWELRYEAATAFYEVYASEQQLDVARETLRLVEDIARTSESMYRVGQGRQADVLRANVAIAKMVQDTLRMRATRETMMARLDGLLDRDRNRDIARTARPRFADSIPTRAWLDSIATTSRPAIRAGLQSVRAADASASLARKEIVPDLQIGVQYGRAASTMVDVNGGTATKTDNMGSVMIGASIPIFARDRQHQMRNEAEAMKVMALAELEAMRAETRGKIGEALANLTRARELARLYRTTILPQAEATVSSARSSYRVGTVDFMTLLDDQLMVNQYRQDLIAMEADEGKAWAELEMLLGHELFDPGNLARLGERENDHD